MSSALSFHSAPGAQAQRKAHGKRREDARQALGTGWAPPDQSSLGPAQHWEKTRNPPGTHFLMWPLRGQLWGSVWGEGGCGLDWGGQVTG